MHALKEFFLNNGIGQNITAAAISIILGYLWSRTRFWPLNILHDLYASHASIHEKLDALQDQHTKLHELHHELRKKLDDALAGGSGPGTSNPGG